MRVAAVTLSVTEAGPLPIVTVAGAGPPPVDVPPRPHPRPLPGTLWVMLGGGERCLPRNRVSPPPALGEGPGVGAAAGMLRHYGSNLNNRAGRRTVHRIGSSAQPAARCSAATEK